MRNEGNENSGRSYTGVLIFGDIELFKITITCKNKNEFKKSSSFHALKFLYPTFIILLTLKILSNNPNYIENYEKSLIKPDELPQEIISEKLDDNDIKLLSETLYWSRIIKIENLVELEFDKEIQKDIMKRFRKYFERNDFSTAAALSLQFSKSKSLFWTTDALLQGDLN